MENPYNDEDRKQEQSFWFQNKPYNFICKRYMYKNIVKNEVLNEYIDDDMKNMYCLVPSLERLIHKT